MPGDACRTGDGAPKDVKEAIRWYEQAAEGGIRFGNECIGLLYYEGDDIPALYQEWMLLNQDAGAFYFGLKTSAD